MGVLAQKQEDGLLLMSLECLYVAGGLGLRKRAKVKGLPGMLRSGNHLIDEF